MNAKAIDQLVEELSKLTVQDSVDLTKKLKEKWGVTDLVAPAPSVGQSQAVAEKKTKFDVELSGAGDKKISVIKVIKEITGLGLKEAKEMVEGAPVLVKQGVSESEAEQIKVKLVESGAQVAVK